MNTKIYDWDLDDRALKFVAPIDQGICPRGHKCVRSTKDQLNRYFLCMECEHEGLYYPEEKIDITFQYKALVPGWHEIEH